MAIATQVGLLTFDGFCNKLGGTDCYGYTLVFRDGIIEATKVEIVKDWGGYRILSLNRLEAMLL